MSKCRVQEVAQKPQKRLDMGHSWREMDPAGAKAHDEYWDRVSKIREQIKDIPLSKFTVGELGAVMSLMGLSHHSHTSRPVTESNLELLEKKLKKPKKKK